MNLKEWNEGADQTTISSESELEVSKILLDYDLARVVQQYSDCLVTRAKLAAILHDLYPTERYKTNLVLAAYECGIPSRISSSQQITPQMLGGFVRQLENDFGIQKQSAVVGIALWAAAYHRTIPLIINTEKCEAKCTESEKENEESLRSKPTNKIAVTKNSSSPQSSGFYDAVLDVLNKRRTSNVSTPHKTQASASPMVSPPSGFAPKPTAIFSPQGIVAGEPNDYEIETLRGGTAAIKRFIGFDNANMIIPNSIGGKRIIGIESLAYQGCKSVESLTISDGIQFIKDGAFKNCSNLKSVVLPQSLQYIGTLRTFYEDFGYRKPDGVFENTSIDNVYLPQSVCYLGLRAFSGCKKLKSIVLNDGLKKIDSWAFMGCPALTHIDIPLSVTELGMQAFDYSHGLHEILLSRNISKIGPSAFCKEITIYCYSGSVALEYARNNGIAFKDASTAKI